jgi:hypothetical protein
VSSHSADRTWSGIAGVAAPALAAAVAALPGRSAAGNSDHPTTSTTGRQSPATADDAGDVTGKAPSVSGAYIYGYDSAGNPTIADAGSDRSFDRKPPH